MVARSVRDTEAAGSSPVTPTVKIWQDGGWGKFLFRKEKDFEH